MKDARCAWSDCLNDANGLFCDRHQLEADEMDQELLNQRAWQRVELMQHRNAAKPETLHEIGRVVATIERANMTEEEFRALIDQDGKPTGERPCRPGRRLGPVVAAIVIGSALIWAWSQTLQAREATAKAEASRRLLVRELQAAPRLSAADRELLDLLHAEAEAQRRHAEMAQRGQLPALDGLFEEVAP